MPEPLLEIKQLSTEFGSKRGTVRVVDGVSFRVDRGETLAIVGESGSGKSMTALSIMRLVPGPGGRIAEGQVWLDGEDILLAREERMFQVRGDDIAMIFQEPMTSLNPVLTIGQQITEALLHHKKCRTFLEARGKASELLSQVGFARAEPMLDEYPHQLSGGMRQRVMIAIALSCNPKLLIADEPTTALDVTVQAQILELIRRLVQDRDSGVILITHDLGVVAELADRVVVMYAGQIVEQASVDELFDNPSHPYTQGLMASIPNIEVETERLFSIAGNVPSPDSLPRGCRFNTRCIHAQEVCFSSEPELMLLSSGHLSRCHIHSGLVTPQELALND